MRRTGRQSRWHQTAIGHVWTAAPARGIFTLRGSGHIPQMLGPALSTFGQWEFTVDRDTTVAAYARAEHGRSDVCGCNQCSNFAAARDSVYPPAFLAFLQSLGIDFQKDGEVYHNGRVASGRHDYGGWFHFVGTLEKTGDFPVVPLSKDFEAWLLRASAPPLESLKGLPLVEVAFHATAVPWVLNEREAM